MSPLTVQNAHLHAIPLHSLTHRQPFEEMAFGVDITFKSHILSWPCRKAELN